MLWTFQQTILKAHRDLPAYRGQTGAELVSWLKTILASDLLNAAEQTTPSQQAVHNEEIQQLADGLAQLRDGERTAIILKHVQGRSLADISAHLGRPPDAIARLLKRGLKKLRAQLQGSRSHD